MEDLYRSQFRLPNALYESLREAAHRQGRSINAEVVARLQQTFTAEHDGAELLTVQDVEKMLAEMRRAVESDLRRYIDETLRRPLKRAGKGIQKKTAL